MPPPNARLPRPFRPPLGGSVDGLNVAPERADTCTEGGRSWVIAGPGLPGVTPASAHHPPRGSPSRHHGCDTRGPVPAGDPHAGVFPFGRTLVSVAGPPTVLGSPSGWPNRGQARRSRASDACAGPPPMSGTMLSSRTAMPVRSTWRSSVCGAHRPQIDPGGAEQECPQRLLHGAELVQGSDLGGPHRFHGWAQQRRAADQGRRDSRVQGDAHADGPGGRHSFVEAGVA